MRQTLLLNIAVFGFSVLLFSSLYHRHPLNRLRFWIGSWLWVVLHFSLLLWSPRSAFWQQVGSIASLSALMLSGVWFLLSVPVSSTRRRTATAVILCTLSVSTITFISLADGSALSFGGWLHWTALLVECLLQLAGLWILWSYKGQGAGGERQQKWSWRVPATLFIAGCTVWSTWALYRGNGSGALNALLMEVFGAYALLFLQEFPPRSAGALTTMLGLACWAAVFPVSLALGVYLPSLHVQPEMWNVPKVFVAFGMLVTLLEDEQARSEREREQYRALFECNPLSMWIYDPDTTELKEENLAATRDFGWGQAELPGIALRDLVASPEIESSGLLELNRRLTEVIGSNVGPRAKVQPFDEIVRAEKVRMKTRDGRELLAEATIQRVRFSECDVRLLIAKDITAQVEAHQQLIHLANHDPLTGLPNRLLLQDRMESAIANAQRHGRKAAVICIDMDRFKQINDNFGHAAGDSCLCEVARRLQKRLRATDTAARTGGEEFMIVLDDLGNQEDVGRVAQDVLAALGAPHVFEGAILRLSASLGMAIYPDDGAEPSVLWNRADAAMYRAKHSGGNQYMFFSRLREVPDTEEAGAERRG